MGARPLRRQLQRQDVHVGRRHLATLMRRMGIEALAPQPGTSKRAPMNGYSRCNSSMRRLRSNSAGLVGRGRQYTAPRLMPNIWAGRVMGRACLQSIMALR